MLSRLGSRPTVPEVCLGPGSGGGGTGAEKTYTPWTTICGGSMGVGMNGVDWRCGVFERKSAAHAEREGLDNPRRLTVCRRI
jgi:hypothetical protein